MAEKSVWFDSVTYKQLTSIAKKNNRSLIGQIRFWVGKEVKK
jgi:hypothetical protein